MKIVVILPRFPYPLEKGDKLRAFHQLRCLAANHEIILCALNDIRLEPWWYDALKPICKEVHVFSLSKPSILWNLFKTIFTGKPFQVGYFYHPEIKRKIHRLISETRPDHIYCQLIRTAEYARGLPYPKTLDYQDVFSKGIERRMKTSPFYLLPVLYLEHKRLLKYERRIFDCFDHTTIISKPDRDLIPHPNRESISVIINGVDTDFFRPREVKKDIDVVFTGNMGYPPNVNAAEFLVKEIMPLVQLRYPEIRVALAGATPHTRLLALKSDKVLVTGWVDDMREYYARSRIFIAPMRIGTGLQNKLLEAMAMRLPCITSDLANQALQAEPGQEILTGSSDMDFAANIILLLSDPELAEKIAGNGHRFVRGKYDWQAATAQLEQLMVSTKQKV